MSNFKDHGDKKEDFLRDQPLGQIESDMLDTENNDNSYGNDTDEFMDDIEELDDEDDSLQRMSDQAMRRIEFNQFIDGEDGEDDEDHDEDVEEEDEDDIADEHEHEDEDEMDPVDFLRRLIQARSGNGSGTGTIPDNDAEDEENLHLGSLRAMGAMGDTGNDRSRDNSNDGEEDALPSGHGFADVVHRIMRDGMMFGGLERSNGEMQGLINNLNQRDDSYIILETLNELSERLLMMNGITAERMIPANKLARSLVNIMEDPKLTEELEINLVACRCLYNFLEVNQDFIHDALNNNAVKCLCGKLLEISCIDLTEQALQTLEMISRDPVSHNQIIAANGLKACLQYLDFLTVHAQRKCLIIVANSCTNISLANFYMVKDVFDGISEVVRNITDSTVIENGWLAISRVIMSFKLKPEYLEELFLNNEPLLKDLVEIIYVSSNKSLNSSTNNEITKIPLNFGSCLSLIKSLIILSSVSVEISRILLDVCFIGEIIVKSLSKYSKVKQTSNLTSVSASTSNDKKNLETITSTSSIDNISIEALMAAPKELLSQFFNLIGYLLPIAYDVQVSPFLSDTHEDYEERKRINESRIVLCKEIIPDSYWRFVNDIWSLLINSFQATMDFDIRKKVLINLSRIISFGDERGINKIHGIDMTTGLLASVINQGKSSMNKEYSSYRNHQNFSFDKKNEGDGDMLVSDDETKEDQRYLKKGNKTEDLTKLNSNALLLSTLSISQSLIEKAPTLLIADFEREGLFNDSLSILNNLKLLKYDTLIDDAKITRTNLFASNYTNKFIDLEFARDDFSLSNAKIYRELIKVTENIENLYLSSKSTGGLDNISDHMKELEDIRDTLNDKSIIETYRFDEWKDIWNRLKLSLSGTNERSQISSFELISSGMIDSLSHIFTSEKYDFGFELNDCYKSFVTVFYINNSNTTNTDSSISLLINKLQEALTRSESFEIISSGGASSSLNYHNENYHTNAMARQVKIKLNAEGDMSENKLPVNMQNMVLSVHAIATFKSIETFIKQRFKFLEQLNGIGIEQQVIANDEDGNMREENDKDQNDSNNSSEEIEFLNNGEVIPIETTIYGAIFKSLQSKLDEIVDPSSIWSNIHNITYRKVNNPTEIEHKPISSISVFDDNEFEEYDKTTVNILKLLKVLFEMNTFCKNNVSNSNSIPIDKFMNWKLTVKLNRQLEEPLVVASGTLPGWCINIAKQFPFIFPLDARMFLLQSTSFGYSRLIHHWQIRTNQENEDNNSTSSQRPQLGRPTRHKVRLSRNLMLQSAVKVLGLYGSSPGILEVEYFDEVGSGLGPTLEFYATVSKEFSKKKLRLWRDYSIHKDDEEDYVESKTGLFPAPLDKEQISSENGRKILYFFSTLGKFIARALLDSRIIDFNFNPVFLKLVQFFNQNNMHKAGKKDIKKIANLQSLQLVDPELADSIEHLQKYVQQFRNTEYRDDIEVDGCTIQELSLYFVLPGYSKFELLPNGNDIPVTAANLELYINKVLEATLYTGIVHQTKAFMDGFSKVFPIKSLVIFSLEELAGLFGSAEEDWSIETLPAAIIANHGYSKESDAVIRLVNILVNFNDIEKRAFLQFLTGAPKLPIGGFKALRPPFTVVRKQADNGLKDDDYLPSVMTCANYLKLPSYSSENVMKEKLLQAVNEGAGAFLLS